MKLGKWLTGAVAFVLLAGPATAAQKGITLQDKQQAACAKDVERLCPGLIPDVGKVTACMETKRKEVSPDCAAMYDAKP